MSDRSDASLVEVLSADEGTYTSIARHLAEAEFARRQLPADALTAAVESRLLEAKQRSTKDLSVPKAAALVAAIVFTQVPAHTHPITNEPAHQHSLVAACSGTSCSNANDGFTRGSGGIDANSFRAGAGGAHNHGGATGNTGTPSVTNLQPFLALRYLIKT